MNNSHIAYTGRARILSDREKEGTGCERLQCVEFQTRAHRNAFGSDPPVSDPRAACRADRHPDQPGFIHSGRYRCRHRGGPDCKTHRGGAGDLRPHRDAVLSFRALFASGRQRTGRAGVRFGRPQKGQALVHAADNGGRNHHAGASVGRHAHRGRSWFADHRPVLRRRSDDACVPRPGAAISDARIRRSP